MSDFPERDPSVAAFALNPLRLVRFGDDCGSELGYADVSPALVIKPSLTRPWR